MMAACAPDFRARFRPHAGERLGPDSFVLGFSLTRHASNQGRSPITAILQL